MTPKALFLLVTVPALTNSGLATDVVLLPPPESGQTISEYDDEAGITHWAHEDFEDLNLVDGLSVHWTDPELGPLTTLPSTYTPALDDFTFPPFHDLAWDGVSVLNNLRQDDCVCVLPPLTPLVLSDTALKFDPPARRVGLGISQLDSPGGAILSVNGIEVADFASLGVPAGPFGRNGYLLIGNGIDSIWSVGVSVDEGLGATGESLFYDHLTFTVDAWMDQGCELGGTEGPPLLQGTGSLAAGTPGSLLLSNAPASVLAGFFIAAGPTTPVPFKGGTLKPNPFFEPLPIATTSALGEIQVNFTMPGGLAAGTDVSVQVAVQDPTAPQGVGLSNALKGVTP